MKVRCIDWNAAGNDQERYSSKFAETLDSVSINEVATINHKFCQGWAAGQVEKPFRQLHIIKIKNLQVVGYKCHFVYAAEWKSDS